MTKAKEALKAELLELYSGALAEMLAACPKRVGFGELEEQVKKPATRILPKTLSSLAEKRGIFSPEVRLLPREIAKER